MKPHYPKKGQKGFQSIGRTIIYKCLYCSKEFKGYISTRNKYCSKECFYKTGRHKLSKGNNGYKFKRTKSLKLKCKTCGKTFLKSISAIRNGEGKFCSKECYAKKLSILKKGKKSHLWKHGKSKIFKTFRNKQMQTYKYKSWRRKVFKRDNFTCKICNKIGGKIEAHHIKSWAKYPKLRYKVSNGLTLCKICHIKKYYLYERRAN